MKIFISWSGARSLHVAAALKEWLPLVLQTCDPWLSSEDIRKGARWQGEIAEALNDAAAAVLCLTSDNLDSGWVLFEAGAASKALADTPSLVCTYLIDVTNTDVELPLGMFQSTTATKSDTWKLVRSLSGAMRPPMPDDRLLKLFERFWPDLESAIAEARGMPAAEKQERTEPEILSEILDSVRVLARRLDQPPPPSEERLLSGFAESLRRAQAAANTELAHNLRSYLDDLLGKPRRPHAKSTLDQVRLARAVLENELGDLLHITYSVPTDVIEDAALNAISLTSFFEDIISGTARGHLREQFELMIRENHDRHLENLNSLRAALELAPIDRKRSRDITGPPRKIKMPRRRKRP